MKLNLKRPLAFFDLEATGINLGIDRIVEISILKINVDGSEEVKTHRVNPTIPIPYEVSIIHGIYDKDIENEPVFKDLAQEIADFIGDADLAGYNSNKFDIPMLMEEFLRAGVNFEIDKRCFVDVQNIFHQMEQRTLKAAYRFYCNKEIINAHSAEADTRATYEVLLAQVEKYEGQDWEDKEGKICQPVVNDVEALHTFTNLHKPVDFAGRMVYNQENVPCFNFGKHKGKPVVQVFEEEPSYFGWMMNGDFPLYTKNRLEKIWNEFKEQKSAQRRQQNQERIASEKRVVEQKKADPESLKPANEDMLQMLANKYKKY
ncbi:exonuclease domain-containing protein [Pseudopedobacter sp.]|uniref:3'-5' exonuclease n=1 Tax=Pseudopedobacter sp. TaxID=1936787 RepID=UPI00333F2B96